MQQLTWYSFQNSEIYLSNVLGLALTLCNSNLSSVTLVDDLFRLSLKDKEDKHRPRLGPGLGEKNDLPF